MLVPGLTAEVKALPIEQLPLYTAGSLRVAIGLHLQLNQRLPAGLALLVLEGCG
jgi:hypothetical protein